MTGFAGGLPSPVCVVNLGTVNLHDWIDELCDVLDLETEVDEGLVRDLVQMAYENVDQHAGPVTAYLVGFAAGATDASPDAVEGLAARTQQLADGWDRPADAADPDDIDDEIPDDRSIDHSADQFEEV